MTAGALLDDLRNAGLNALPYGDWENRGHTWGGGHNKPAAVMHHHTAAPVPFPTHRLIGSRLKANIQTQPDGKVWLLASGACNYSSGPGNIQVLQDLRNNIVPTQNARQRNLPDNFNGNPWYFNFENDHLGKGQPIPQVQLEAIVTATRVVLEHYGLPLSRVISHAEHTRRKTDPYWNNNRRCIDEIRQLLGDTDMPLTDSDLDKIRQLIREELEINEAGVSLLEVRSVWNVPHAGRLMKENVVDARKAAEETRRHFADQG